MKEFKQFLATITIFAMSMGLSLQAHDFTAVGDRGQKLYFNVIDQKRQTVELTNKGSITDKDTSEYVGDVVIPAKVKHNNVVYEVVAIAPKAFSNAAALTSIVMPLGITTIGDFAFEGCTSLNKIVFPGNPVSFGEGAFFRCTAIGQVSLGSDWEHINLKMFRWSEHLKSIYIPAKLVSIQNMKSLKSLETITVDVNNDKFVSHDGILYNKDMSRLLGCPRARMGKVRVCEGVTAIDWDAFIDCPNIDMIDLPTTLKVLSFREFSRMKNLKSLIMRSETPLPTATKRGENLFVLNIDAGTDFKLVVPKKALKEYQASICSEKGEFCDIAANASQENVPDMKKVPVLVETTYLVNKKSIIGVKNFDKFE